MCACVCECVCVCACVSMRACVSMCASVCVCRCVLSLVHNMTQSRASRRVAWRCGALQRVGWFTIFAHTRVCDLQPPHPSHVYSFQSTKFMIDHERELEIVLVLALYLRQQRRRKCGGSMWIRGIFTRRQ